MLNQDVFFIFQFYIPISIATLGCMGNLITFVTIIRSNMRKNYLNKYLMVLLLSDTVLLVKISAQRLFHPGRVNYRVCFLAQYFWNAPIYVSNLTIVLLTMERFFAILFPFTHLKYSHFGRWQLIWAMICFSLLVNFNLNFVLREENPGANNSRDMDNMTMTAMITGTNYTTRVNNNRTSELNFNTDKCQYRYGQNYACPYAVQLFLIPRTLFTFLLPLCAVIVVNVAIAIKLRARSQSQFNAGAAASPDVRANNKVLFIIPAVFVLLNLPYNLYMATLHFLHLGSFQQSLNVLFLDIFFINHAINFLLYAMTSRIFRQTLLQVWIYPRCRCENDPTISGEDSKTTQETKV